MKTSVILVFLIVVLSTAFSQSAKKLNKQLRAQLVLDQHKQDSAHAVFLKDVTYLEELRSDIHQKVRGPLADEERHAKRSVYAFENASAILKALGVNPQTLVSDSVLPVYPYTSSHDVIKPLREAWDSFLAFDLETRNGSDLDQYKVKEQNDRLFELISSYQNKFKSNQNTYREQREFINRLEEFKPQLDRLITLYKELIVRADKAHQILTDKAKELEANYKLKGPKGFPEAYRHIFPDAHPVYPKKITSVEIELAEGRGFGGDDNVGTIDPPIQEPTSDSRKYSGQEPVIYDVVEEPAEYPGGAVAMKRHLKEHVYYPLEARERGVSGKVYLKFVVSDKGQISDVKIMRGIPDCPECDWEALRVIKGMPNWIPGKNNGKAVNSFFTLPIQFKL